MHQTSAPIAAIALAVGTLNSASAQTSIADIAPADTMFVITMDSWATIQEKADRIGLMDLWNHPQVQRFMDAVTEEIDEDLAEMDEWFDALDMDPADFPRPTGTIGIAMFSDGVETDHLLAIADFGDDAEEAEEQLETLLEGLEDEEMVELDFDKVGDVRIHIVTMLDVEEEDDADDMDDWEDEWEWEEEEPLFPDLDTLMIARVDNHVLAGTSRDELEDAIDAIMDGRDLDALADTTAYADARAQHDGGGDMFGLLFINDMMREGFGEGFGMALPMMGLPMEPGGIAEALGIDDLQAISIGITLDTEAAMVEQSYGILVPKRGGLFRMLAPANEPFVPPAFVGADASSVTRMNMAFDQVFPILKDLLGTMPDEMQAQLGGMLDGVEGLYGPMLKALGPEMYITQTIERPLSVDSATSVMAIRARDQLAIANAIGGFAGQMGMEARDFQGNQLYEEPLSGQGLGIGFGYLFIGDITDIENAMRMADNPANNALANEDRFIDATDAMTDDAVIASFTDLRQTIEMAVWQMKNAEKIFMAEMEAMGIDPAMFEGDMEDFAPETPAWIDQFPDVDVFLEYFGDTIVDFRATDDGFRGKTLMLRPRNAG